MTPSHTAFRQMTEPIMRRGSWRHLRNRRARCSLWNEVIPTKGDPLRISGSYQFGNMPLRYHAASSSHVLTAHPQVDAGSVNACDCSDSARAAKFVNYCACWVHNANVAAIATRRKGVLSLQSQLTLLLIFATSAL